MNVRYATVCSGIEAMSLAVKPFRWKPVFFSDTKPFACSLLAERYPHVPNLGDMTKIKGKNYAGKIDVLTGGTPCQSFSTIGKREGLSDPRGRLMLSFVRLAFDSRVPWVVWENVPGVLFQDGGRAFSELLSSLTLQRVAPPLGGWANSGICLGKRNAYSVAWRVLDAQYTRVSGFPRAVPQARRRVWLVGCFGNPSGASNVLFESGNPPEYHSSFPEHEASSPGNRDPISIVGSLKNYHQKLFTRSTWKFGSSQTLTATDHPIIIFRRKVRETTPEECERLMGVPVGYTRVKFHGALAGAYPRFDALGNSWAVNCARWVMTRLNFALRNNR